MPSFGIGLEWDSGEPSAEPLLDRLVFRPDDDNICVWVAPSVPGAVRLAFDVNASSYAEARARPRRGFVRYGSCPGRRSHRGHRCNG
jgi:hypothetical protein